MHAGVATIAFGESLKPAPACTVLDINNRTKRCCRIRLHVNHIWDRHHRLSNSETTITLDNYLLILLFNIFFSLFKYLIIYIWKNSKYYNKKQHCSSRVVMVTDEKPQVINYNIQYYFKSIERTITFKLCLISQFKCNDLPDFIWNRIENYNLIFAVFHHSVTCITTLDKQSCILLYFIITIDRTRVFKSTWKSQYLWSTMRAFMIFRR